MGLSTTDSFCSKYWNPHMSKLWIFSRLPSRWWDCLTSEEMHDTETQKMDAQCIVCVCALMHSTLSGFPVSHMRQSPELNECLFEDGSVILLGGFEGVSLQASWVRVLGRSGTQTHRSVRTHAHTHTQPRISSGLCWQRHWASVCITAEPFDVQYHFACCCSFSLSLLAPNGKREPVSGDVQLI